MPAAAAFIAGYVADLFVAYGIDAAVYAVVYVGVIAAEAVAIQKLSAAAQAEESGRFASRELVIASAKAPQTVVYGTSWSGGVMMYANARHTPATNDDYEVWKAVAHCARECESITDLYYDNDLVLDTTHINWGTGKITGGKYGLVGGGGTYAVELEKYLGTSAQTASPLLTAAFPADWTSAARARGICYTVHKFTMFSLTAKTIESIFYAGVPQNIRAKIKGAKVYDPRADSTNGGTGSQRFATSSTWTWSENPILCCADYLTQYMGIAYARVDWTWIRSQADVCDVLVAIPVATTAKRYTCNGMISLGNTHKANVDAILSSCAGTLSKVSGKWRPTCGSYITPDVSISEADIVGEVVMTGSVQREDRYNSVVGVYFSAADYGMEIDSLPLTLTAYQTRDGQKLDKTLALSMTNSEYQAQRLAYKHLLQSDQQIGCVIALKWTGLKIAIGTRVSVSYAKYAWVNKSFRCVSWKTGGDSPISVVLREDALTAWADPTEAQYSTRSAQGIVTVGTVALPTPTAGNPGQLPYYEDFEDGDINRIHVEWPTGTLTGDESIVAETGTPPAHGGQYVWQIGDNSGNDTVQRTWGNLKSIPIEQNVIYRLRFYVRRVLGTGTFYLGIQALAADQQTIVTCASSGGNQHYFAGSGYAPPSTAWVMKEAYFYSDGASTGQDNTGVCPVTALGLLASGTRYIKPFFYVNYTAVAGKSQIGYVSLERVSDLSGGDDLKNSTAISAVGGSYTWTTNSAGNWPAGDPTHALTATFYRNGASIATHVSTATLTTATGSISTADTSSTGEATTYSEAADPSAFVTVTITHTASARAAVLQFTALNIQAGGSVGK